MFGTLTEKLQAGFAKIAGRKKLTEENVSDAVREVRLSLLEADVAYPVVKTLIKRIKERAVGQELVKSVSAGQQFIKIVHDELAELMGGGEAVLNYSSGLTIIVMCGLQGSGKTTTCAKLARYLQKERPGKTTLLAACDLQRPAAIEQLKTLGEHVGTEVFSIDGEKNPRKVVKAALEHAKRGKFHHLIVDTAGRLHVDEQLMEELDEVVRILKPHETLFVANAATGQDAVKSAEALGSRVEMTGSVLTMLDGDLRGGAAISIREITGKPLKFEGVGERIDDLQLFNASSMADRILGMGDVVNLVKRAQEHVSEEEAERMQKKLLKASFTFDDYLKQMQAVKKMGSLKSLLKMLPVKGLDAGMLENSEAEFKKTESIILSMTPRERRCEDELSHSRRRRLAGGSGTDIGQVNKLVKSFKQAKSMMKKTGNMKKMKQMMKGETAWR